MESKHPPNTILKITLLLQTAAIIIYTYLTIQQDGGNFFAAAFEYLSSMSWKGQFTLDFFCYLLLSGLWIMWRGKFALTSVFTAIIAMIFGILFLAPYLLYLLGTHQGDLRQVLLGEQFIRS